MDVSPTRVFAERRKTGRTDLEAMEMALRATLHQVGASALGELLRYEEPDQDHRKLPCPCGQTAQYLDLFLAMVAGEGACGG